MFIVTSLLIKKHYLTFIFVIQMVSAAFYEQLDSKNDKYEKVLYKESAVPSSMTCIHICKVKDTKSVVSFNEGVCQCLKVNTNEEDKNTEKLMPETKLILPVPIDGGLSDWINVGTCSVTCGEGTLHQMKTCTNPAPQHGGKNCPQEPQRSIPCKTTPCPVDGGLSDWINVGGCSVSCGGGTLDQIKTCTNPAPRHGGKNCPQEPQRSIPCKTTPCPVDGGLSDWINVGKCPVTCGEGTLHQMKTCTNPAPQYGGKNCTEKPRRSITCNNGDCPVDGGLSDWLNATDCTVTCGGGTLDQKKTCTNPAPQYGGKNCIEEPRRSITCNDEDCPPCIKHRDGGCCKFPYYYNRQFLYNCWKAGHQYVCFDNEDKVHFC